MPSTLPPLSDPDIRQLRVFHAVALNGGFSAAQFALGISRSTISAQMAELETRLGVTLCHRGRRGFALTEDGQHIFKQTEELFAALDKFRNEAGELRNQLVGTLRIGVIDHISDNPNCRLPEAIARFSARAPNVQLVLSIMPPNYIENQLLLGRIDLGITTAGTPPPAIRTEDIFREDQWLYCGRGHILFEKTQGEIDLGEIADMPYVAREYMVSIPYYTLFSRPASAITNHMEGLVHLVLSGRFLGFLPGHLAETWVQADRMRRIRADLVGHTIGICLAHTTKSPTTKIVQLFRKCVVHAHSVRSAGAGGGARP
jgi:DNA-binding transcriptional LysR family regulator